ncbi:antitoxin component YwqK of YwqJK toxin-antitoxin module [Pontibacter aydingkolensis]|uniref:MORN repeat variant n=1 Tax=Pontibacter aydingkolensis TaxID=1911536 RepID=A0ABS7CP53_9BACT|nr:hypothetical protein [Pontibacter aydingkolensis]MBW7465614.1 hypothetical protein [Pontibacter aydingkolensis]
MKTALLTLLLTFIVSVSAFAQTASQRRIPLQNYGPDSLHIPFNADYFIIEDSCAQIVRHVRFDRETKKFYGNYTDHSTTDPDFILSRGSYSRDGLKNGPFMMYYTNGKLRAEGVYSEDEFAGTWQLFYESGNPKLTFTANKGEIDILNAWDENGKQLVSNGKGKYSAGSGFIIWSGQLANGKPDGTWVAYNANDRVKTPINTEKFKGGHFIKGTGPIGAYTNASRINLINLKDLPHLNAEKMAFSAYGCDAQPKGVKIVGAQFRRGLPAYSEEIKKNVSAYLSTVDLKPYDNELNLKGEVSEDGRLVNLRYDIAFNTQIADGLIRTLSRLPALEPALVDGKPSRQPFEIKFRFQSGFYQYNYRFMPIHLKK